MGKRTFERTKTILSILMLVFFVISMTAAAVSACTSTPATSVSVSADNSKAQCNGETSKPMNMAAPEEVSTKPSEEASMRVAPEKETCAGKDSAMASEEVNMKVAPEKGTCSEKGSAMAPEPVKSNC
jgi:hypothetical protein